MIFRSFPKRLSIWLIVCAALCSAAGDMRGKDFNEVVDSIYDSPLFTENTFSQESYIENEIPNDLLSKVAHLSLPLRVEILLVSEYHNETFKHIELGGTYSIPQYLKKLALVAMCLFLCLLFIFEILIFLIKDEIGLPLAIPMEGYLLLCTLIVMFDIYTRYKNYIYPGYLFCTDTGILIIEQGTKDKFSWLFYEDINFVKDYLDAIDFITFKRVLRTIDKMKQVQDFDSGRINPVLYNDMVSFLTEKVGNT